MRPVDYFQEPYALLSRAPICSRDTISVAIEELSRESEKGDKLCFTFRTLVPQLLVAFECDGTLTRFTLGNVVFYCESGRKDEMPVHLPGVALNAIVLAKRPITSVKAFFIRPKS